jgi:putative transposase
LLIVHHNINTLDIRKSCYRPLADFRVLETGINQLWQTDFTYMKVTGWGWYYLSIIMDDYSRYIISWRLCTGMAASDVSATLKDALKAAG